MFLMRTYFLEPARESRRTTKETAMPQQSPLSEEQLAFLMRDERWWHPRKRDAAWQRMIAQGFERLYPANDTAQGEGRAVHVDAYARQRDGKRQAVAEHFRGRPGSGAKRPLPAADRDNVTREELLDAVGFDPKGPGEIAAGVSDPAGAAIAVGLEQSIRRRVEDNYGDNTQHNEADAVRHAAWSMALSIAIGDERAQRIGDAHERGGGTDLGSTMMDLYNNHVGRLLGSDPDNFGRDPVEAAIEAASRGGLRTRRYAADPLSTK